MKTKRLATFGLLTLALAAPVHAADAGNKNPPAQSEKAEGAPRGTVVGSAAEDQRYAMREAASPDAKKYKGGDVVVISTTAAVIVVLAVVILILVL